MSARPSLGLVRVESLMYYVEDLERTRRFLIDKLDFVEIGESDEKLDAAGKSHSAVFQAGNVVVVIIEPRGKGGRAYRWLQRHPEGVGTIVMEVKDIEHTFKTIEARGGTPVQDIEWFEADGGKLGMFSITTPFGDTTLRFVERKGYRPLFPGFVKNPKADLSRANQYAFGEVDHITSNFLTMAPALLWMEHVLGFERYWTVQFHTQDVDTAAGKKGTERAHGSGLKSIVMWDPESGIRFANNEPCRPFFSASQIAIFVHDHRGDGIQHAALTVKDIQSAVRSMRGAGVEFMPTPGSYYDMLPQRLKDIGVNRIDENIEALRELQILVDGGADHSYMLQIFLKEAASLHRDREAGPFFFEVIQRKGDKGFGAGNFRALFESIERQQKTEGRA
ncbi:MAG: VOC family protein [Archangiaceae bacterium]|nr:VOC family protein [Archangiaceae bacterium]